MQNGEVSGSMETEPTNAAYSVIQPQWTELCRFWYTIYTDTIVSVGVGRLKIRSVGCQTENRHVFTQ